MSIGTCAATTSMSTWRKLPSGHEIRTGMVPRLAEQSSPKQKNVREGENYNLKPLKRQYALAWLRPITERWAPIPRQAPLKLVEVKVWMSLTLVWIM